MADVKITGLHKRYGGVHAVRGIDLEIPAGEFTVLVGRRAAARARCCAPSPGWKRRMPARIEIGGQTVNHVRPRDRDIAMVFQNYALYPYMNVYENIAFGLRARKMPDSRDRRQGEARRRHAGHRPAARTPAAATLRRPAPARRHRPRHRAQCRACSCSTSRLSNLDAQLRDEMRGEIKRLHQRDRQDHDLCHP